MDFDNVKENIQPLATGRNVTLLQASLRNDSPQELLAQRKELEDAIKNYDGGDPLDPWYAYVCWIEQSYPSGGSESGLQKVLRSCLARFENDSRYKQDRRLIKLFIKFMDNQKDPLDCYQEMYNSGIGTMVADFYIAWAYSYDLCGNMRKADEIFRRGVTCRAEPLEDLKEAHQHFGYSMAQRMLYMDGEEAIYVNQELNERRKALQSLHSHKRKGTVGSIRTGTAVKSQRPGIVVTGGESASRTKRTACNVDVFNDENRELNAESTQANLPVNEDVESEKTTLRSLIDEARNQENLKEPGPWNQAHDKKKQGKLFGKQAHAELAFTIHTDESETILLPIISYERKLEKPFIYPANFVSKNQKQTSWLTPVTIEEKPDVGTLPNYNKCMLYPRPNIEFQPEEYRAYCFFLKQDSNHGFVSKQYEYWAKGDPNVNVRCYPNFANTSKPQDYDDLDKFFKPQNIDGLQVNIDNMYNEVRKQEYQLEELIAKRWHEKRNDTIHCVADMEETLCILSDNAPRRKSFFPVLPSTRKSIAATSNIKINKMINSQRPSAVMEEDEDCIVVSVTSPEATLKTKTSIKSVISANTKTNATNSSTTAGLVDEKFREKNQSSVVNSLKTIKSVSPPSTNTGGFFDADETCSTQLFNIFIKNKPVSTPKGVQKMTPARQFGTILKESEPVQLSEIAKVTEPETAPNVIAEDNVPGLCKQLSTILETSEHGTHSSGATNGASATNMKSGITSSSASELSNQSKNIPEQIINTENTPGAVRLQAQKYSKFNLSVHKESPEDLSVQPQHMQHNEVVGNFMRLEQHEDTAPKISCPIRFQEDKTETITKSIIRFQDDKTETIPKLLCTSGKFEGDQRTTNISKLAPALPNISAVDDTFNFFAKSPEKSKVQNKVDIKLSGICSPVIQANVKRLCDQQMPEISMKSFKKVNSKLTDSFAIFEDELSDNKLVPHMLKKNLNQDSFASQVAFNEDAQANVLKKPNAKSSLDSFMMDFFSVDDEKPKIHLDKNEDIKSKHDALIPPFAVIDNGQSSIYNKSLNVNRIYEAKPGTIFGETHDKHDSFVPEFSVVEDMKPNVLKQNLDKKQVAASKHDSSVQEYFVIEDTETNVFKPPPAFINKNQEMDNLTGSFMSNLSFIRCKPDAAVEAKQQLNNFDICFDDTLPETQQKAETSRQETSKNINKQGKLIIPTIDIYLDNTLPETQETVADVVSFPKVTRPLRLSSAVDKENAPSQSIIEKLTQNKEQSSFLHTSDTYKRMPAAGNTDISGSSHMGTSFFKDLSEVGKKTNTVIPATSSNISDVASDAIGGGGATTGVVNQNQFITKTDNTTLKFLADLAITSKTTDNDFFEFNAGTEVFKAGISNVQNSTLLPKLDDKNKIRQNVENDVEAHKNSQIELSKQTIAITPNVKQNDDFGEMSIYYKTTPRTPKHSQHIWSEIESKTPENKNYVHQKVDHNQIIQLLNKNVADPNVNPFNVDLTNYFLDMVDFTRYIANLKKCQLVGQIKRLHPKMTINFKDEQFEIIKMIGEGAYGTVFTAKHNRTGKLYALKQERPPNYWEYNICLEVHSRLADDDMMPGFMNVEYALIGNNASILMSTFSTYGSLIVVCNKIKKYTTKNIDEYVVMLMTCQLLAIFDHLHAIKIIHADVKADNVLLMEPLSYPSDNINLQLIDFGVSIDMERFPDNQTFNYVNTETEMKCVEMRLNRPWSYQLDLYGLAGVIHILLFGKYMDIEKRSLNGIWMPKERLPRYFNKAVWEYIFRTLLNIRDCTSMPNLQELRTLLKAELVEKEKYVINMVQEFNRALKS